MGEYDDTATSNSIMVLLGWTTFIDLSTWDNEEFLLFIKNLENKIASQFNYFVDADIGPNKGYFKFDGRYLSFPVWDYGQLYSEEIVEMEGLTVPSILVI